ncbi:MAG: hypothetical protein IKP88_07490 [Lachnospiraceae bacterium]|nr:hypothetical protein [Lachnospiraceae bacterium]
MKGNEKSILIGMAVVAVLIVLAAFKFFYSADIEKADQVQNEINTLQARLNELNEKNANRSMYEAGIASSGEIIDTVLSIYGPGNTAEKTIMMVVDLCHKTGISVSDLVFQEKSLVYSSEVTEADAQPEIQIYKSGMALNVSAGYTQMKKLMDYINSYPERMNAEDFHAAFNAESGRLDVSMNVNMYAVVDKNHEYKEPVIEDIELSNSNIFRTLEVAPEEETEEGVEETGNTQTNVAQPVTQNTGDEGTSENTEGNEE